MTTGTLWQPSSPCDVGCLPGTLPLVPVPLRLGRLLRLAGVLVAGVALLPVLPLFTPARRAVAGTFWARAVLWALGIRFVRRGPSPRGGALVVANHISWLDTVAVLAAVPARMVAKHDVRGWPVIGALAAAGGTLFVDRTRPRRLPYTVAEVTGALRAGAVVAAFPEGTTWCGTSGGRFRPALFQAAIDAGRPIVPVTIAYTVAGRRTTAAAFVGPETLWTSLCRVVAVRGLQASLVTAAAVYPVATADRRVLARVAESAVRGAEPFLLPSGAPPADSLDLAA